MVTETSGAPSLRRWKTRHVCSITSRSSVLVHLWTRIRRRTKSHLHSSSNINYLAFKSSWSSARDQRQRDPCTPPANLLQIDASELAGEHVASPKVPILVEHNRCRNAQGERTQTVLLLKHHHHQLENRLPMSPTRVRLHLRMEASSVDPASARRAKVVALKMRVSLMYSRPV